MFLQIHKILSNFDSNPLIFDSTLFPDKNSPDIAKRGRVFSGKGRWDRALILTYFDNPMTDCLYFSILAIFRGNVWSKLNQKCKLWVRLFFINLSIYFQSMFFARAPPLKFLSPEVALYLYKSTIRSCMEYCCHVWAGAPSCYLELLDKLQKRICRTVGPSLAASLEPLAHRRNMASLSLFYRYYFDRRGTG